MVASPVSIASRWLRQSANGRIFSAFLTVFAGASFVKLASLAKEILVARYFGAGDALDAFYIALLLPAFLIGIVATSFQSAFLPIYLEVHESQGKDAAQRLLSSATVLNLAFLLFLSILLTISGKWLLQILGSGFSPEKIALTRHLFFILLASLFLSGLSTSWRTVLNAHEDFALTAIAPIMVPITIAILLFLRASVWGIYAITLGYIFGLAGEAALAAYGLRRRGIRLFPSWHGFEDPLRRVLLQSAPAAAGAILMGSTTFVDQSMAAMLGSGSVSALNYANKLVPMMLNVGTASLAMAVLPSFSRLSAANRWQDLRHILSSYTVLALAVTVPLSAALILFSHPLIRLIFQRGAFSSDDARLVAHVQSLLAIEMPFYALSILYVNAISALKRNELLICGTIISVVANVTLNYLFMKLFGLAGIALSTSAVSIISAVYLFVILSRTLREYEYMYTPDQIAADAAM